MIDREANAIERMQRLLSVPRELHLHTRNVPLWNPYDLSDKGPYPRSPSCDFPQRSSCDCCKCDEIRRFRVEKDILSDEWYDVTTGGGGMYGKQYNLGRCACTTVCCFHYSGPPIPIGSSDVYPENEGCHMCVDAETCVKAFALRTCRCGGFRHHNGHIYERCEGGGVPGESDGEDGWEAGEDSGEDAEESEDDGEGGEVSGGE